MNQTEYRLELEKKMGYCQCAPLKGLYIVKKTVDKLKNKYDEFDSEMDYESMREGDQKFIEDFCKTGERFVAGNHKYHQLLFVYLQAGNVKLILHNPDLLTKKTLSLEDAARLSKERALISANCAHCDNLIDLISSEN